MRAQRFELHLRLRYRPVGDPGWHVGRTENISHSGVLFRSEDLLPVNTPVQLRVALPMTTLGGMRSEVQCEARIVRAVLPSTADPLPALAASIGKYQLVREPATPR